ncbi:MAG: (d)CMP kinase [Actinomycetales bacterium]|nr:(d)CMP kinase [Actinomycetales bacterium]
MSEIIAIDGPAGSGKSTVARALAAALGWSFLDTGAMYRAVTAEVLRRGVDPADADAVAAIASSASISTVPRVTINGLDVEAVIRDEPVNVAVSTVAANPVVRSAMVTRQRAWADAQPLGTVVEGRDIATVVFPDARLKVYLTASLDERARRRGEEGVGSVSRRDRADEGREASPLRQASDAVVLDTTDLTIEQVVEEIVRWLKTPS